MLISLCASLAQKNFTALPLSASALVSTTVSKRLLSYVKSADSTNENKNVCSRPSTKQQEWCCISWNKVKFSHLMWITGSWVTKVTTTSFMLNLCVISPTGSPKAAWIEEKLGSGVTVERYYVNIRSDRSCLWTVQHNGNPLLI